MMNASPAPQEIFLLKLGEVVLKGQNRQSFEDKLLANVRRRVKNCGSFQCSLRQSTIYVEPQGEDCDMEAAWDACRQVFGIAAVARAVPCEKTVDAIVEAARTYLADAFAVAKSFKVESKRADKAFPMTSIQLSQAVGGVLPVFYFLNKRSTSSIHLGRAQWNGGVIRSACINGSSELMTNLSMSLVNILYNYQLLRCAGENGVAAYGVIMYAAFLFVAVFVGYAVGSAPIVSYHYGARNHAELNNLYSKSLRLIGVIAVVMTALSMLVIPYVARIFVGYDAELLALTSHAFRVYALNFFLMGFNVYGSSFFTALGDGVTSALISFLRTLLFQLLALIFLPMVLGIEGVWLAVTAAEAGALCVTVLMFITKDKVFHYRKVSC